MVMPRWCHVWQRVQPPFRIDRSPLVDSAFRGAIAQLEEHLHGMQGVRGSSPRSSTNRDTSADLSADLSPLAGAAGGVTSPRTT